MNRYICIHGHFYQPPRENPWLEEVELQDSARPFHDWNERITAECYRPNTVSRILDDEHRIKEIVNNFEKMSFNVGPTLLAWMERKAPETLEAIVEADVRSRDRFGGHGSAMAQVYNHMIMPLAGERDRRTQVHWGMEDFRRRFGRDPEGMWLPETAVDLESLDILAEFGVKFTILAPNQVSGVRRLGSDSEFHDVSGDQADPTTPYVCKLPSGREIALFVYDGPISRELAFEGLLTSGETFRNRLMGAFTENGREWPQLVHIATDGETYGHHHRHGEMALSYALRLIEEDPEVGLINYGQYLEEHPPQYEIKIFENSSWSCVHGVERWKSDCGCNSGMHGDWHQKWRKPLRNAMNWLAGEAASIYEEQGPQLLRDPWKARDDYIHVLLDRSPENLDSFLSHHCTREVYGVERVRVLKLLELERYAQLIFTSCGWFFDEISGIETVQVIQYAVRAIQLAQELGAKDLSKKYVGRLSRAPSNVFSNGAEIYSKLAKPAQVDMHRVCAHYAMSALFAEEAEHADFACYQARSVHFHRLPAGRSNVAWGEARISSTVTTENEFFRFAVLTTGDHNVTCGVSSELDESAFKAMAKELSQAFEMGDMAEAIRTLDRHFGKQTYSVRHLFRDEQRKVVGRIIQPTLDEAEQSYRSVHDANYALLNFLHWLDMPVDSKLMDAAKHVVNADMLRLFEDSEMDVDRLRGLIEERNRLDLAVETETLQYVAAGWINRTMERLSEEQDPQAWMETATAVRNVMEALADLPLHLNLGRAENVFFDLARSNAPFPGGTGRAERAEVFARLGEMLKVRLP
ncbi:DUF3536 domain-containing protein [Desulfohalovibrio reitneri]|uniref:DUF3536 domain-containing protein n=1 Tax=Desulfohalovibrio reitneri TaxID=1307759 RepID=UPI0004A6BD66|nr:DUF3536 domain-containing protein [Desulfohalovibrio reitneri]